MTQTVVCQGQKYKVEVREVYNKELNTVLGHARINGVTWVCLKRPEGYWKATGRKAVPLDRR